MVSFASPHSLFFCLGENDPLVIDISFLLITIKKSQSSRFFSKFSVFSSSWHSRSRLSQALQTVTFKLGLHKFHAHLEREC